MTKLYTIKGENPEIKVFILEKASKIEHKNGQLPKNKVCIQSWTTGETSTILKDKLEFYQEFS